MLMWADRSAGEQSGRRPGRRAGREGSHCDTGVGFPSQRTCPIRLGLEDGQGHVRERQFMPIVAAGAVVH